MGLFTARDIPSGTHIVFFDGELLTDLAEIKRRSARSERGGYLLSNATTTVALDCFKSITRGHCLASMSNCPYECYNTHRDRPAFDNARLTYKAWVNGHYQWGLMSKLRMRKYFGTMVLPTFIPHVIKEVEVFSC